MMRLRQIALATRDLDKAVAQLAGVFGLKVAYNDPSLKAYGLRNAVLPTGPGFLELVEPIDPDASAGRFLARRGGEAGYMLILQCADAEAERARVVDLGVRVVEDIDTPNYRSAHFHPGDFGGVLVSFDQQRSAADLRDPHGDWSAGGPDWRAAITDVVGDMTAVVISSPDPEALVERWSKLLDVPRSDGGLTLRLTVGEVRFEEGAEGAPTSIAKVELRGRNPAAAVRRAGEFGCDAGDGKIVIAGVEFAVVG